MFLKIECWSNGKCTKMYEKVSVLLFMNSDKGQIKTILEKLRLYSHCGI